MKKHGQIKNEKPFQGKKKQDIKPQIFIYRGLFYIKKKFNKHIKYFTKDQMEKNGCNVYIIQSESQFAK